jgi:transcriptional regulator, merR family
MYTNFFKFHFRSEGGVMLIKENQIIKATELAKLLGITDRHLRNLANEGVIKKTEKGKYLLLESVRGYIEYIESKNDVDLNLKDEKIKEEIKRIKKDVELKDLKIKETKNQLHLASIVEKVMTDMLMNIKGKLLSISSKVAPAVIAADNLGEIQDVIQDEIFEVLEELSEYDPDMFKNNKIFIENEEDMEVKVESEKRTRGRPKKNS